jgi:hypothetical protein
MRPYSEAVKAEVRPRMSPPNRQSVVEIARELGIHTITLYKWRKAWRLQGEVVPASEKEVESWSAADKFTVVFGDRWPEHHGVGRLLQGEGVVPRAGGPLAQGGPGCQCPAAADHERPEGPPEEAPGGPAGNQTAAAAPLIASKKIQAYWGEGGED